MKIDKEILESIKITPIIDSLLLEDISDEIYFSKKYSDYISNSRLGLLKSKGVEAFFKGIKSEYNPSFELGGNLHQLVLQPESYELIDSVARPTAKAGLMAEALYRPDGSTCTDDEIKSQSYIVGYYKDKLTENRLKEFKGKAEPYWRDRYIYEQNHPFKDGDKSRIYTDEKSINILKSCLNALNQNDNIQKLLQPEGLVEPVYTANERTILLNVEVEIPDYEPKTFKLKSKLDNFTINTDENVITVNDLKTTSRPVSIFDPLYFSYNREIGMYSYLLKLCSKKFFNLEKPQVKGNFLVVSTTDFSTSVVPMTKQMYKSGFNEFIYLLKTVCYLNIVKGYNFEI